jgi:hypothetical protein
VLLKQDKTEAVMSVNGRLEFIEKQIKDIEKQIKGIQDKSENIKMEVCWSGSRGWEDGLMCGTDYADTTVGTTVTASGRGVVRI